MIDLERFRSVDSAYHEFLIREYGSMVLLVAQSYGKDFDRAEDLFQEIWMHAFEKRASFEGRGSFGGWLHRLAKNVCIEEYRARKTRASMLDRFAREARADEMGWTPPDPLSEAERQEYHLKLHRAMGQLSEREHEAVTLRIIEGREPEEVARIMGLEKATVRSHIRHAMRRLKNIMEEPGDELSRHESAD